MQEGMLGRVIGPGFESNGHLPKTWPAALLGKPFQLVSSMDVVGRVLYLDSCVRGD